MCAFVSPDLGRSFARTWNVRIVYRLTVAPNFDVRIIYRLTFAPNFDIVTCDS
jgi:hypothetical protein